MGIKGLPKLIQQIAGDAAIKVYKFSKFKGWAVAVDASLIIHQTVIAMRGTGKDMTNSNGGLTSHLHGLFYKILIFLQNEMVPIFVFDGKAPNLKNKTIAKRRSRKVQAEKNLEELSDSDDEAYIKQFKQTFTPKNNDIKEAQILLDLMGIPYINSPGEADIVCSWLASRRDDNGKRYVEGVCSDDSDMLPLGACYLFKDMLRFMSKNKQVKVISLKKTLVKMNLTMDQFIDLCVLLGTDYCENIKGVGPKGAYRLMLKYGSLEKVLSFLEKAKKDSSDESDSSNNSNSNASSEASDDEEKANIECIIKAKNYFKTAVANLDESKDFVITDDQLKLRKYQYEELMDFMCVKHNFDVVRVQTGINRLETYHKQMNVTRENTKKVHKILHPRSENYIFTELADDIDFLPSDEEDENDDVDEKKDIPSKKNKSKREMMKKMIAPKKKIDLEESDVSSSNMSVSDLESS